MEHAKRFLRDPTAVVSKRAQQIFSGDARLFFTPPNDEELRAGLASDSVFHQLSAMKRIIAQMCRGVDMAHFFPDVVKTIHSNSSEMRNLVYFFVVHYAEQCPSETLLSISAFQRDLVDSQPHVRAMALRMLGSIPIPAIQSVVLVALRKCADDLAPIVRKAAAIAVFQVRHIAGPGADLATLQEVLGKLMQDRSVDVLGAAAMAFNRCCGCAGWTGDLTQGATPTLAVSDAEIDRDEDRAAAEGPGAGEEPPADQAAAAWLALVHPVFRRWCQLLVESEECGQVEMLRLLTFYARTQFHDPNSGDSDRTEDNTSEEGSMKKGEGPHSPSSSSSSSSSSSFASSPAPTAAPSEDDESSSSSFSQRLRAHQKAVEQKRTTSLTTAAHQRVNGQPTSQRAASRESRPPSLPLDPDHLLLLNAARPLLRSLYPSPVLAVTALFYHCAPHHYLDECTGPLLRVLQFYPELRLPVLSALSQIVALRGAAPLQPYASHFYLRPSGEASKVQALKLGLLSRVIDAGNVGGILRECNAYLRAAWLETKTKCWVVQEMGWMALRHPEYTSPILRIVLSILMPNNNNNNNNSTSGAATEIEEELTASSVQLLRLLVPGGQTQHRAALSRAILKLTRELVLAGSVTAQQSPSPASGAGQRRASGVFTWPPRSSGEAHATVLWMAAETLVWNPGVAMIAPDLFRVCVLHFPTLPPAVKREALYLGLKVWLHMTEPQPHGEEENSAEGATENEMATAHHPASSSSSSSLQERFTSLLLYAVEMAGLDTNIGIRDEARILSATLASAGSERPPSAMASLWREVLLRSEKTAPCLPEPFAPAPRPGCGERLMGSWSQLLQAPPPTQRQQQWQRCTTATGEDAEDAAAPPAPHPGDAGGIFLPPWAPAAVRIDPSIRDPHPLVATADHWSYACNDPLERSSSSASDDTARRRRRSCPGRHQKREPRRARDRQRSSRATGRRHAARDFYADSSSSSSATHGGRRPAEWSSASSSASGGGWQPRPSDTSSYTEAEASSEEGDERTSRLRPAAAQERPHSSRPKPKVVICRPGRASKASGERETGADHT